jgi:hypothetical protein
MVVVVMVVVMGIMVMIITVMFVEVVKMVLLVFCGGSDCYDADKNI